uniref:Roc domain-containing protein n=1 Tax=Magallana gigas TaxID=29159 RepID=A0A8W8NZG9_MAGGI
MVIGCAEAGKTTLIRKLKGEKNITTTTTKGIEINVHEFELDDKECTIKTCEKTMDIEENTSNASANEDNLKMLSLLDFAGQSAYYACHHIFFSPRAFYILVVDISKDLNSQADKACDQEGLIYSNWTYADYIKYWLGSIHTYGSMSAPVILVFSHSEDIGADPDKVVR